MLLSTLSCTCWPFVYLLWKNVSSGLLSIFKLNYLVFCCWVVSILYIFYIVTPYQIPDLQIFSPFCRWFFSFLWSFLLWCRRILLWYSSTCLFWCLTLGVISLFFTVGIYCYELPLTTVFAASHKFWYIVVFPFSFFLRF